MGKLTVLKVKHAKPGVHSDGDGLILRVKPSGAKSWVLRVQHAGKRRDIGLGSIVDLTLAEARDRAAELRKVARRGADARAERDREKVVIPDFAQAVKDAHAELSKGWGDKTAAAFKTTLETHAVPSLGRLRVDSIGAEHVVAALASIWTDKPQQARKVRHRIMQVLSFAKSRGWRTMPIPDPGEIRRGLSRQPRSTGFAAVPYGEVPALVRAEMLKAETPSRLALLFTIFTAARSGEVRNARWEQIDVAAKLWARPAEMMKSDVDHTVTLSAGALRVIELAGDRFGRTGFIFPAPRAELPLSDMALSKILRLAGRSETVHGFRSSFRDWAAEQMPEIPAMVAEMALAHSVGTATEKAYLRSDLRSLRFKLADAWSVFLAGNNG